TAYVSDLYGVAVSVIDTDSTSATYLTVIDTITVGSDLFGLGPYRIAVNPAGNTLYVAYYANNKVSVVCLS
ncbi:MAG: hypothetical protein ACKOAZ_11640, partial [Ilumatobacteraceae bacterium]